MNLWLRLRPPGAFLVTSWLRKKTKLKFGLQMYPCNMLVLTKHGQWQHHNPECPWGTLVRKILPVGRPLSSFLLHLDWELARRSMLLQPQKLMVLLFYQGLQGRALEDLGTKMSEERPMDGTVRKNKDCEYISVYVNAHQGAHTIK